MAIADVCQTITAAAQRQTARTYKAGSYSSRFEVTYHGVDIGASADTPVAGTAFIDFARAVNGLAMLRGMEECLPESAMIGRPEFALVQRIIADLPDEHQGANLKALRMRDMAAVTEEDFRTLVESIPALTAELNAATERMKSNRAQAAQSNVPLIIGAAAGFFLLRALWK